MDHWRMARRMGIPFDDFWSLSPLQFDWFVDDWWDQQVEDRLQIAQLESTLVNISRMWSVGPNDPPPEFVDAMERVVMKRPSRRPGMVQTVKGWVSEEELRLSKARIQQRADQKSQDIAAGVYRG